MSKRAELGFFAVAGALFFGATLLDAYNTELSEVGTDDASVARQHFSLEERLGYAVLTGSGYAEVSAEKVEGNASLMPPFRLDVREYHPNLRCAEHQGDPGPEAKVSGDDLFLAILSAEKYNRSALTRKAEILWAETLYQLTGHAPDLSLGLGQIRPSTIRADLAAEGMTAPLSERELLEFAASDCSNILATSKHVRILLANATPDASAIEQVAEVARAYNGSIGGATENAYVAAVVGAYKVLRPGWSRDGKPAASAADDGEICIGYQVGATEGYLPIGGSHDQTWDDIKKSLNKAKRLEIAVFASDPGPITYVANLIDQRRAWIIAALDEHGLPPGAGIVTAATVSDSAACWAEEEGVPPSRATIRVFK